MKRHYVTNLLPPNLRDSLRLRVYRAEVMLQKVKFSGIREPEGGWPILMANSFPKSGTHLLDQVLMGFSRVSPFSPHVSLPFVSFDGETGMKKDVTLAQAYLNALRPLDVTSTHLLAWPEVMAEVNTDRYVPYFIYRDPRDVVVSHVFYITEMEPTHAHSNYYNTELKTFGDRLKVSILGRPDAENEFPDINKRFGFYAEWLNVPNMLSLRYEDFVNDRYHTLGKVVDHFLKRVNTVATARDEIIKALEININPKNSPTFRTGKTGEWKKYFKEEHKKIFKEVAGQLLIDLGYEKNLDW